MECLNRATEIAGIDFYEEGYNDGFADAFDEYLSDVDEEDEYEEDDDEYDENGSAIDG